MPYRSQQEVETFRFPLRTPPLYLAGFWLLSALTALATGFILFGLGGSTPPFAIFLTLMLLVVAIAFWSSTEAYRIGGMRGELTIEADVLTLPGGKRGEVVRLPLEGLAFQRAPMEVRFSLFAGALPMGTWRRGEVIVLRNGATTRTLSTLTSTDPAFADKLMAALAARTIPTPEMEKLDKLFNDAFRSFADAETRVRVGHATPARQQDDAELEQRIDDALRSEKE